MEVLAFILLIFIMIITAVTIVMAGIMFSKTLKIIRERFNKED